MKHKKMRRTVYQPMYPNAADPRYFHEKALEIFAAILSGTGVIMAMLFLVTLS